MHTSDCRLIISTQMNSEIDSCLELLKSINKLIDITSQYADETHQDLFDEIKRDQYFTSTDTETIFSDSLSSLIKVCFNL